MTKFYQYLNEKLVSDETTEAGEILSKDCTEIIDFYRNSSAVTRGHALFRGTKKKIDTISDKIKPRKNRKPKDTPRDVQKVLDKAFNQEFGGKPRSSGIFTFGDNKPSGYGFTYTVFPSNGFEFLGSPHVRDLYIFLTQRNILDDVTGSELASQYQENPEYLDEHIKEIVDLYTDKNLDKAIISSREIMIKCDYYYLVAYNTGEGILDYYIKG